MTLFAAAVREEAAALPDHCEVLALGVDVRVLLKCVSDGADGDSATTWRQAVDRCGERLAEAVGAAGLVAPPA